jgi:4-diphosphocytidyl-2-C-methyl-D-erythritol kinase
LGSDVPACLLGVTALGGGRGELLEPLGGVAGTAVLLINPGVAVSTAKVFGGWDRIDRGPISEGETLGRAIAGRNDLEAPARALAPAIDDVLAALRGTGETLLVRMSGSGATCFALYASEAAREVAAAAIRASRPGWWCLESVLT